MGSNMAKSESLGMQNLLLLLAPCKCHKQLLVMAIVDSQNSKSVPAHSTTSSVPQRLLEELQVQEANRGI
jgi:hypothetical protein